MACNNRTYDYIEIPLTLERHLENYSLHPYSTERHRILWTTWCQNKRWLTHMLEYTLPSFQTYSKHDASHAEAVIHNMELVLGEERIKSLSATDTFMLLHAAYIHDIGMCITEEEKNNIIKEKEFLEAIKCASASNDSQVRYFSERILNRINNGKCFSSTSASEILEDCLSISLAISYFLAEYRRKNHGEVSAERLNKMVLADSSLGVGFSTSEVSERIFIQIGQCSATHTIWGFDAVRNLDQKNNGYAHDYIHPRFIAVLLQIADALDIDNGRFHSLIHSFYGKMNHTSELHFQKHQSIRQLNISDKSIYISANCNSQDVLRLIRRECNYLEELLKNVNYYWSEIAPEGFSGCMPLLATPTLLYNDTEIPHDLINAKFSLSQDKAFKLIEGTNVYGSSFPYLKEVIQNAIDATKIQVWMDYQGTRPKNEQAFSKEDDEITYMLDARIRKLLAKYPIEISLEIVAIDQTTHKVAEITDYKDKTIFQKYNFAVSVKIQDHGIGISAKDILKIANVGISHTAENDCIENMPKILIPTGKFGIGLQSVFQVTDTFTATTRTHFYENYQINFSSGSGFSEGVINTTPLEKYEDYPFGTQISFVVPGHYRADRSNFRHIHIWENPFEKSYINQKNLKQAEELLSQMVHYINGLFGIKMFPVVLEITNPFSERSCVPLHETVETNIKIVNTIKNNNSEPLDNKDRVNMLGWAFQINKIKNALYKGKLDNNAFYLFDTDTAKLYIWSKRFNTFASLSGDRLYKSINYNGKSNNNNNVRIYYKGMVTEAVYEKENHLGLVDYLDIQDAQTEKILLLNREGFTNDGKEYIVKVYDDILYSATLAYEDIAQKIKTNFTDTDFEVFFSQNGFSVEKLSDNHNYRTLFSLCMLSYHALLTSNSFNAQDTKCTLPFKFILKSISSLCKKFSINELSLPLQNITDFKDGIFLKPLSDVMNSIDEYGILSYRRKKSDPWENKLFSCYVTPQINAENVIEYSKNDISINVKQQIEFVMTTQWSKFQQSAKVAVNSSPEEENFSKIMTYWLFANTPTKELYTFFEPEKGRNNTERNIRFTRMSSCVPDEILMDDVSLFYLFEKMYQLGKCDKPISYCSPVFQGYKILSIIPNNVFDDILSVKNSFYTKNLYHTMLIPFSNIFIQNLVNSYPEFLHTDDKKIEEWEKTYYPLSVIVKRWSSTSLAKISSRIFANDMLLYSQSINKSKESLDQLLHTVKTKKRSIDSLIRRAELFADYDREKQYKEFQNIIKSKHYNTIVEAFYWVQEGGIAELFAQETLPSKNELGEKMKEWESDETLPNLLSFTIENAIYHTSKTNYMNKYAEMIQSFYEATHNVIKIEFIKKAKLINI